MLLAAWPLAGGNVSYVVLQDSEEDSLVRVSADCKTITTIANGAAGVGLAVDAAGNYVVAAKSSLLRVTPSGVVTTIATAPEDAEWSTVAVAGSGDLIVADGKLPVVWRISPDGMSVLKAANYGGLTYPSGGRHVAVIVDASGDYLVLEEGNHRVGVIGLVTEFYRITPAGVVKEIALKGVRAPMNPVSIVSDGVGGFLIAGDVPGVDGVFRLAPDGLVTKFAELSNRHSIFCVVRNSETGDLVIAVGFERSLLRIRSDDRKDGTLAAGGKLLFPTAIVAEASK